MAHRQRERNDEAVLNHGMVINGRSPVLHADSSHKINVARLVGVTGRSAQMDLERQGGNYMYYTS